MSNSAMNQEQVQKINNTHENEYLTQIEKFKKNKAMAQKAAWNSRWKNELRKEEVSTRSKNKRSQESLNGKKGDNSQVADLAT